MKYIQSTLLCIFAALSLNAQISITSNGTAYTENFNSLGTSGTATLPAAFTIGSAWTTVPSSTTQVGGTSTAVTAGGAYNFGNGVAASATDRALGFLSSSSYAAPRSIIVAFTNNTGGPIGQLNISFNYEKYRTGTRAFDWTFFHGSSSTAGTAETTGNQSYAADANNTTVVAATAIPKTVTLTGLNIPNTGTYYLRWTYTGAGGSSNAQALGIDDFSLSTVAGSADVTPPLLASVLPANNATNVALQPSLLISFDEAVSKGTGNIFLKKVSDNSTVATVDVASPAVAITGFAASINIGTTLDLNTNYYVEMPSGVFTDIALNAFAGINNNSTWNFTTLPAPTAGIIGNNYTFANCATNFLTEGWRKYSVTGATEWTCVTGRTGAGDNAIQMNAFVANGNHPLNEDWLISPPFDLSTATAPTLKFYSTTNFTGNGLTLKVSTNFISGTAPSSATWVNLNGNFPAANSNAWTLSDEIDLSAYNTTNVYLAWVYSNPTTANSSRWNIDDVTVYTNIVLPPCDEPSEQPTALVLSATAASVTGNYTAPATAPSGYIVVRSTSATLSAFPADATNYNVGNAIGGGTVIAKTAGTNFTDNGLNAMTTYYYSVFAYNSENCSGGPNYNIVVNPAPTGNTNNITTQMLAPCVEPLAGATALNLSPSNNSVNVSFTASASANKYLIIYSTSNTLSATPTDGAIYVAGTSFGGGTVAAYSNLTNTNITGLMGNTAYYIFVFAANADCTGEPNYFNLTSLNGTATTLNGTGAPAGYYDATNALNCQPLKTTLKNIISANYTTLSYTPGLWNLYYFSDKRRNDANTADIVWDMYSDNPNGAEPYTYTLGTNQCGSYTVEGQCYNREHSTPQSWFNSAAPMVSDAHHIFATDGRVNAVRSNFPYGYVTSVSSTSLNGSKLGTGNNFGYTGTVFEPIDEYKGDFARAALYMAVRYEDEIISQNWSNQGTGNTVFLSTTDQPIAATRRLQVYDDWFLKTMVAWHNADPVSAKEIERNNVIFSQLVTDGGTQKKQGNRNPFVDRPDFVNRLWGVQYGCTGLVPIKFVSFTAAINNGKTQLNWVINEATSVTKYIIEKKLENGNFIAIAEMAHENKSVFNSQDVLPLGLTQYRIKALFTDGTFSYSSIATVIGFTKSVVQIFPNPAQDYLTVRLNEAASSNSRIEIINMNGQIVHQENIAAGNKLKTTLITHLANGHYIVKISENGQLVTKLSFVKK